MQQGYHIREVRPEDAASIAPLYNHYILNSPATFELDPISVPEMETRIRKTSASYPYWVLIHDQKILAYAYLTQWKSRAAYVRTVESSVYVHHQHQGQGLGKRIYSHLFQHLEKGRFTQVIAGVVPPNEASVKLHLSLGFVPIGIFKKVGHKFGQWWDVSYYQLELVE